MEPQIRDDENTSKQGAHIGIRTDIRLRFREAALAESKKMKKAIVARKRQAMWHAWPRAFPHRCLFISYIGAVVADSN
jgi:hypothetical protein